MHISITALNRLFQRPCLRGMTAVFALPFLFLNTLPLATPAYAQGVQIPSPEQLQQLQQQLGAGANAGQGASAQSAGQSASPQPPQGGSAVVAGSGSVPNPGTDTATISAMDGRVMPRRMESLPNSRLEDFLSKRSGNGYLRQFGYDQLGYGRNVVVSTSGAVQDDYILGTGDEVVISLRGQENSEVRSFVNRTGQVVVPRLSPISAAGRSFGEFRQDLQAAVHRSFIATEAFVSIGQLRQISVLVSGEVNNPGLRTVNGLTSVLDAIALSGGVKKTGSLRAIRVQRGDRIISVDLYSVLTSHGASTSMRLADGDRILVPLLGPVVAVTGMVRQPGIYELAPRQAVITAKALVALAGGAELRGIYRLSALKILPNGTTQMTAAVDSTLLRDSEILFMEIGADQSVGQAVLSGGTALAGKYPVVSGTKLSDVLKSPGALGPSPYTLFGIIARRDPRTLLKALIPFTPLAVIHGSEDMALQSEDVVRPLSLSEARTLTATVRAFHERQIAQAEALRNPLAYAQTRGAGATVTTSATGGVEVTEARESSVVAGAVDATRGALDSFETQRQDVIAVGSNAPNVSAPGANPHPLNHQSLQLGDGTVLSNIEVRSLNDLADQLGVDPLVLVNFLTDHQAVIDGAIRGPGSYLIGSNVSVADLLLAAGGSNNWTDESGVELISTSVDSQSGRSETTRQQLPLRQGTLASYIVRPHDELRFNRVFSNNNGGSVTLQGEVRFPGTYQILRGEKLSELLARAGGLTNVAYPYGTVYLRKSVAALERDGYIRAAKEMEDAIVLTMARSASASTTTGGGGTPDTGGLRSFVAQLRAQPGLGRISVAADPSILAAKPDRDLMLEAGDVVYIPQRPGTVSVLGQVMQQGSYPYQANATVGDYIAKAGGYARFSQESLTYVVLPDGSARKVDSSWLSYGIGSLPPGSAIVVPRDVTPLDLRQTILDVSQLLSSFAVSIASLAVLSKN